MMADRTETMSNAEQIAARLTELAERCEAATGPDREMDREIDALLGWQQRPNPTSAGGLIDMMIGPNGKAVRRTEPTYTASLDAALTLVPEGWHLGIVTERDEDGLPHACLTENAEPCRDAVGDGADMALSICAAALRAREILRRQA